MSQMSALHERWKRGWSHGSATKAVMLVCVMAVTSALHCHASEASRPRTASAVDRLAHGIVADATVSNEQPSDNGRPPTTRFTWLADSSITSITPTTTTTTTTTTTITTTTNTWGCVGVAVCLGDEKCAQCLSAINATPGFSHSFAEIYRASKAANQAYIVGFFRALQQTASCSSNATQPATIYRALEELNIVPSCVKAHGMWISPCLLVEYACFVDPHCQQCLGALHTPGNDGNDGNNGNNGSKTRTFDSPECTATNMALLKNLQGNCGAGGFPECTFQKQTQCASLPECASCLATLAAGDGAMAARQCRGSTQPAALAVDNVVTTCIYSSAAACDFWRQRCADNVNCNLCLADMSNGDNALETVASWLTTACQEALHDRFAASYLISITQGCPGISACRVAVTEGVKADGGTFIACINGSAPSGYTTFCSELMQEYSIDSKCQSCPTSVHTINAVVFATSMVGGVSAVACLAVAATIVAHRRDRVSMRDRIVVGLMMANAVYSTANAIPLNALRTSVIHCGRLAMSFDAIRFGRAWWFCGKYGLVSFELVILGASIQALLGGMSAVSARTEAATYAACCAIAALAFAVFYALCSAINADGYNLNAENEAYTNAYNHASANDDLDDDEPSVSASETYTSARDAYDNLVRDMLVVWDVVVGVAVGLWIVVRALHHYALHTLRTEEAEVARAEAADEWAATRQSAWNARRSLLETRRDAFNEVAKPLEPYIAVFVVFAAPAVIMSTPFCQNRSGAIKASGASVLDNADGNDFTYGTCDVWCEFVLAFRSLGAVAVYLLARERRAELVAVRSTWRKLCVRAMACLRCKQLPYAPLDDHQAAWHEMQELEQRSVDAAVGTNNITVVATAAASENAASWHMNESDITLVKVLGSGAFGEVWEGVKKCDGHRVAVKVMRAGAVDEDGDIVDLNADEDFRKECDALQRVSSPHLLKFYGFGTTAAGSGFIVTELMLGGSLEDVLHDTERILPWETRMKIALQVALGMEHLHQRHMLHRDLKSANVLLDEELRAKVCDFGLSRVVRPARRQVVRSSFTGVTRLLPDGLYINNNSQKQSVLSLARIAVSFSDSGGNLTKAAGTLLWMAPEVYRGDQHYTGAVDVYSFGIVLWELATRKTPWAEELPSNQAEFIEGLNSALQKGRRPELPDTVRTEQSAFVAVMEKCWAGDPTDRPAFSKVVENLAACVRGNT